MLTVILHVFARFGPEKQLVGFSSTLAVLWRRFSGPYGRPRASRKGGPRRLDTGIRPLAQNLFGTLDSVQGIGLVAQNLFHTSCLLRRCCKVLLMEEILHHFKWPSTAETPRPRLYCLLILRSSAGSNDRNLAPPRCPSSSILKRGCGVMLMCRVTCY